MCCVLPRCLQQQNGPIWLLAVSARQCVWVTRRNCPNALSRRFLSKPMGHDGVCDVPSRELMLIKCCVAQSLSVRVFFFFQRPIAVRPLCCRLILQHVRRLHMHPLQPWPILRSSGLNCSVQLSRQPVPAARLFVELPALPRTGLASNSSKLLRFRTSNFID